MGILGDMMKSVAKDSYELYYDRYAMDIPDMMDRLSYRNDSELVSKVKNTMRAIKYIAANGSGSKASNARRLYEKYTDRYRRDFERYGIL